MRSSSRRFTAIVLLAVVIGLFEVPFAAFMADDLIQLTRLERLLPAPPSVPFGLYTISDGSPGRVAAMKAAGAFPWFFDPSFKMALFRPLSSVLLAADHALFGLAASGYRAHGALWFVLLVAALGWLYRRSVPGRAAPLALFIFTVSGIHGVLAWTATRHIVIAAAIAGVGLSAHVRWREDGWRPGRLLAPVAFALALAASEAALGMMAFVLAFEVLARSDAPRRRVSAILPLALLAAGYVALYQLLGFGTSPGAGYIDPVSNPARFVAELAPRLAVLVGGVALGGNADLWVLRPDLRAAMAVVGAAAVFLVVLLLRELWGDIAADERRAVKWLGGGAVLAAVPFAGSPIGSRCLVVPFAGGCVVLAILIESWWRARRARRGARAAAVGVACAALAALHLVLSPIGRLASPAVLRHAMSDRLRMVLADAELPPGSLASRRVVVLAAPDLVVGLHSFYYRVLYRMEMPASWRVLSWARAGHRFARTGDGALEMTLAGGELESPLRRGDTVDLGDLRARVLDAGRLGPRRVSFEFDRSLDDDSIWLLAWRDGALRHLHAPALGAAIVLPQ